MILVFPVEQWKCHCS